MRSKYKQKMNQNNECKKEMRTEMSRRRKDLEIQKKEGMMKGNGDTGTKTKWEIIKAGKNIKVV